MSEDRERIQLGCSNCTCELGTIPMKESMDTELICPHCGAVVTPPSPIERLGTSPYPPTIAVEQAAAVSPEIRESRDVETDPGDTGAILG
ncbi:MAG TPA: hypothetical protein VEH53_05705 [archaeon]|nr:hypothetical protein [archaeon]